jgi:glutathione peroxidase-family protein
VTTIRGEKGIVADHVQGKKLYLIVNVASKWGLAKVNFNQLVQMH